MKKIISNLDKSVRDNSRITHSDGLWRSEHSPESYDLWGGDTPNELLNQIFYWPAPNDVLLPLWPYYYIENRRCDQQWFRHFNIPNLAITLVLEGRIEYTEDNQSVIVGPGEVMLQMPGSSHRMINADEKPTHKLVVLLSGWGKEMFSNAPGFHSSGKVVLKNH
ncbi:MAG: cupin domain-containing protein, partial [Lentisphaeria bacterium]|nr:cupin domain-containing protein [Lentisphaeria bacterium]